MGKKINAYSILVGKRPLGRWRSGCEDNIKTDLTEKVSASMDRIDLAQNGGQWRDLLNIRIIGNIGKFFIGCARGGFPVP
jgi:hypothetical protein